MKPSLSSSCQFSLLMAVSWSVRDLQGLSGAKYSQTLSCFKTLAAVNCLRAQRCFEELRLCLVDGTGGLAELLGIPAEALCLWPPYGREKTAI